jgi:RimJ/RimL family protein N-acetyltransferase
MTMKVSIRPWHGDDAPALVEAVTSSLEELKPWMPWAADEPQSVEQRRAYIRGVLDDESRGGDRARAILADGEVAGACGLHRRIGPDAWELGYWVATSYTGHGVATTAVRLLCTEAFLNPSTTHVEIHHATANTTSGAVARRSGFTRTSTSTESIWRLTRTDWESRRA